MGYRIAEDGNHGVADELLDRSPETPDDRPHAVEVPDHDGGEDFGVQGLCEGGRSDHVAEQNGDGLARLEPLPLSAELRAADRTEASPIAVLLSTRRASAH